MFWVPVMEARNARYGFDCPNKVTTLSFKDIIWLIGAQFC